MQWGIKCKFIRIARDNALPEHIHHHGNLAWKVHGFLAGEPSMEREERIISLNRIIGIAVDVRAGVAHRLAGDREHACERSARAGAFAAPARHP